MEQDDAVVADSPEPRWLKGIERDAWLSLIGVIIRLPASLDTQLQRDAGLSHFEYIVMVNLSNAEGHVLRMSQLAALCHSSLSRLSHVVARLSGAAGCGATRARTTGARRSPRSPTRASPKLASAAPGHVEAVREYVIDALDPEQLRQLTTIGETILGRLDGDTPRR